MPHTSNSDGDCAYSYQTKRFVSELAVKKKNMQELPEQRNTVFLLGSELR